MNPSFDALVEQMTARVLLSERKYLEYEDGHQMSDAEHAIFTACVDVPGKGKDYRPYCLGRGCAGMPRLALRRDGLGFGCSLCGNALGFDLVRLDPLPPPEKSLVEMGTLFWRVESIHVHPGPGMDGAGFLGLTHDPKQAHRQREQKFAFADRDLPEVERLKVNRWLACPLPVWAQTAG